MSTNLLSLAQQALGGDFAKLAGQFLGESEGMTQAAMTSLLPAVIGGIAQKGATPAGASSLLSLIGNSALDTSSLGNIAGLFGNGGAAANALLKTGTSSLVPALFGEKSGALVNALASASGIKSTSATNLIAMVVPLVLAFLKKLIGDRKLDAGSLSTLLAGQGPNLQGSLDSRITSALGFASPATFLGSLGGQAADAARKAGAAVAGGASAAAGAASAAAAQSKSGLRRWLPWLLALLLLWLLWQAFMGRKPAAPPAAPPVSMAPAPAPAPAVAALTLPTSVYFETGSATIGSDGTAKVNAAAELIKKDGAKVDLTGFTDKTGDEASNLELAKQRAMAVRAALVAAGVPEGNIGMQPPAFVTGTGSDAEARRVEIKKQ
jgi:outer membrane protein OmpA-like peptidoglycan-associated protein